MTKKKYQKYMDVFNGSTYFYGLGIENEAYLTLDKFTSVTNEEIKSLFETQEWKKNHKMKVNNIDHLLNASDKYNIPIIINYYFIKQTTLWQLLQKNNEFKNMYKKSFTIDVDLFEFITQNFYKTTVKECINELNLIKKNFIKIVKNILKDKNIIKELDPTIKILDFNYGIAKNLFINNISTLNNGSYHINLTLPVKLNDDGNIIDVNKFISEHMNAIRAIQWLEPLLIIYYSSPDIFSICSDKHSKCSSRLARSKFISVGTYDTDIKQIGKRYRIFKPNKYPNFWFNEYHEMSNYITRKIIGHDINFNNYKNHGMEIRFFDSFPEIYLEDVINIIILICQHSLEHKISNSIKNNIWNTQVKNCMIYGHNTIFDKNYLNCIEKEFNINLESTSENILQCVSDKLYDKYHKKEFVQLISPNMKKPQVVNFNEHMTNLNKKLLKIKN